MLDFLEDCSQLTRLEVKKFQAFTTKVKIYFEQKIQNVKEFHQIENEIPLILHVSINQYGQLPFPAMLCFF